MFRHRDPLFFCEPIAITSFRCADNLQRPEKIRVKHEEVTDENAVQWASRSFDSEIDASARIL